MEENQAIENLHVNLQFCRCRYPDSINNDYCGFEMASKQTTNLVEVLFQANLKLKGQYVHQYGSCAIVMISLAVKQ